MTKGEERALDIKTCKPKRKMCLLTVPKKLKDMVEKVSGSLSGTRAVIIAMCEYLEGDDNTVDCEFKAMLEWEVTKEKVRYNIRLPIDLVQEFFDYQPEKSSTVKYNEALWGYVFRRSE